MPLFLRIAIEFDCGGACFFNAASLAHAEDKNSTLDSGGGAKSVLLERDLWFWYEAVFLDRLTTSITGLISSD